MRLRSYRSLCCLLRYIVTVDLDELIVPRYSDDWSWADMIRRVQCVPNVTSYGVRQLLYSMSPHQSLGAQRTGLITLDRVYRNKQVYGYPHHGKYIADSVQTTTNMLTHRLAKPQHTKDRTCLMPINIGGNHHYRSRRYPAKNNTLVLDDKMTKYGELLWVKVADVIRVVSSKTRPRG